MHFKSLCANFGEVIDVVLKERVLGLIHLMMILPYASAVSQVKESVPSKAVSWIWPSEAIMTQQMS